MSFFYEDFTGLEGALEQRSDQSGKRSVIRGTEFAKTTPIESLQAEPADSSTESGDNGAHTHEAPAPIEGSQAEAGPCKGEAVRPAAKAAGRCH